MNHGAFAILPVVELLLSASPGDAAEPLCDAWEALIESQGQALPFVWDNRREAGALRRAAADDRRSVPDAIREVCSSASIYTTRWTTRTFQDSEEATVAPQHAVSCSIGAFPSATGARGLSLCSASPSPDLAEASRRLFEQFSRSLRGRWRWMVCGYRFVPVPLHGPRFGEALKQIQGLCCRFKAVDVGDPFGIYTSYWQDHLRTVHWLTAIADDLLTRAPTWKEVETASALEGGVLFQAGDKPSKGDVNRREDACAFGRVHRALAPLLADPQSCFFPLWTPEEAAAWLHRLY